MKNILIIGGSGFIGSNLLERLGLADYKLFVLNRKKKLSPLINSSSIKVIEAGLDEINLIKKIILDYEIEIILHLASNLIPSSSKSEFDQEIKNITLPTFQLLNFISENNLKIIFFSSGGTIYGKSQSKTLEDSKLEPINYYGYSKLIIENHIRLLKRLNNLRYVILRPANVYGKYQKIYSNQGFIAVALGKILSNKVVEIWGDGNAIRDYVDVSDVTNVVKNIIDTNIEDKIFNVGSGKGYSINKVIQYLEKYSNKVANVVYLEKRKVDLDKMILDISSLKSYFEYNPKNLDKGIRDYVEHLTGVNYGKK